MNWYKTSQEYLGSRIMNWYKTSQEQFLTKDGRKITLKEYKKAQHADKGWFGDWENQDAYSSKSNKPIPSMAVNKDGMPQVMYHGTLNDFDEFEVGQEGYNSNVFGSWKTTRNAIFFTPDPNHASAFTSSGGRTVGGNIKPVYLNVRSPLNFTNGVDNLTLGEFEKEGINPRWLIKFEWSHLDGEDGKLFVDAATRLGYDGVIFYDENPETRETMETWAVFRPDQIRSIYQKMTPLTEKEE